MWLKHSSGPVPGCQMQAIKVAFAVSSRRIDPFLANFRVLLRQLAL